jgi:ribosomal protein S18 acetylase RimI-like enzyme
MISVRRAAVRDAALLSRLGAELFAQTFGEQNRPEDLQEYLDHAFNERVQSQELADSRMRTWLAEDGDGAEVGYVQLRLGGSSPVAGLEEPAELARIYADARWHGRGVGVALLDACVAEARSARATHLWLGVWKQNPRGIAFYEKHGFRVAGEQTFQLGRDTQHDWIMLRDLRPATPAASVLEDSVKHASA